MNDFISTFSFYGVLRIIIPGLHLFIGLNAIANKANWQIDIFGNDTFNTIAVTILIIVLGLFVYSFDFPRMIRSFTPSLPTKKIAFTYKNIPMDEIEKSYFRFYYSLEPLKKEQTERYNGFYHLVVNLCVVSFFVILLQFIFYLFKVNTKLLFYYNLTVMLLSFFSSIKIYKERLIKTYKGDLKLYYASEEFKYFKKEYNIL